jgi:non-heme chloroperoxidase
MAYAEIASTHQTRSEALASEWTTLINLRSYHYVTAGAKDAPALLYLHGYADSWRGAELLIPLLQDHFRIFALDQRGHGESDADFDRFAIDDFVRDAVDFIEHVVDRKVTLIGHCLGGVVAQHIAAQRPDLVERLVLIGTTDDLARNERLRELRRSISKDWSRTPRDFARAFRESTLSQPLPAALIEQHVSESQRAHPAVWSKVADALLKGTGSIAHRIAAPTLLLWGEADAFLDRVSQLRLETAIRQVRSISYKDAGHAPNLERPAQLAQDILAFCRQ